ncbi:MAG: ATP-dependent 6-phosphofructokinase [bacterium]|nr:ATP-dependent 6-phosphofructokinase [bacterium]
MLIGVFCSGGDAPGMNACVRAVVRAAFSRGHEVIGIRHGYEGLLKQDFQLDLDGRPRMSLRSVSNWSRYGGAMLRSSRSDAFRTEAGQKQAADVLRSHGIEGLIPIGGDGTLSGALALAKHWDGQIVAAPGTIDNDLAGTVYTIGFSTAVDTAVDAVDKIRDTAESHERMFLVEVMGRHSGHIAVHTAVAGGAEVACIPETTTDIPLIVEQLKTLKARGKTSIMAIVAEGDEEGGVTILNDRLKAGGCPFSTRVVVLGHLQRGGSPTPEDRLLATTIGAGAVAGISAGKTNVMCGIIGGELSYTPLESAINAPKPIPPYLHDLIVRLGV